MNYLENAIKKIQDILTECKNNNSYLGLDKYQNSLDEIKVNLIEATKSSYRGNTLGNNRFNLVLRGISPRSLKETNLFDIEIYSNRIKVNKDMIGMFKKIN